MSEQRARPNDPFTPLSVGPDLAAKISNAARLGFPDGGYRICRKCDRSEKLTVEQIHEFTRNGIPRCLICKGRTELLTPDEMKRMDE